jgi:hypothetical protein
MPVSMTITGEDEIDFRRALCRLAAPYLENFVETGGFDDPEPNAPEPPIPPPLDAAQQPEAVADAPKRTGRPRGSTNKPKANGNGAEPPQTETPLVRVELNGGEIRAQAPANGALVEVMSLAEQIQIITDAAHDQPDKFKPLLVPLRDKLGVQYVSKAAEKDRPVLQAFINEHGLAV